MEGGAAGGEVRGGTGGATGGDRVHTRGQYNTCTQHVYTISDILYVHVSMYMYMYIFTYVNHC